MWKDTTQRPVTTASCHPLRLEEQEGKGCCPDLMHAGLLRLLEQHCYPCCSWNQRSSCLAGSEASQWWFQILEAIGPFCWQTCCCWSWWLSRAAVTAVPPLQRWPAMACTAAAPARAEEGKYGLFSCFLTFCQGLPHQNLIRNQLTRESGKCGFQPSSPEIQTRG